MHLTHEPEAAWCIVKSVRVRNIRGDEIGKLKFGTQVLVLHSDNESRHYEVFSKSFQGSGFVPTASLSFFPIKYMARLPFYNAKPYEIPVAMRYKGRKTGVIEPDCIVSVIAITGDWCLTNRGWTKHKWLKKSLDIDDETIKAIAFAVVHRAVNDYRLVIHKLRKSTYRGADEYINLVNEMDVLRDWFSHEAYRGMFNEKLTGQERLRLIDRSMNITRNWVENHHSKRDALVVKNR